MFVSFSEGFIVTMAVTMTDAHNIPSPYEFVTVIGNAQGDWEPAATGISFIFNGTSHPAPNVVNICNGPYAGSNLAFTVANSPDNTLLVSQLTEVAETLQKQLNCWPSSGLVTIMLMSILAKQTNVQRMSLLPNLGRCVEMQSNQHLPCVVHNWLGERRLASGLKLANPNLNWPELFLTPESDTNINAETQSFDELINPFSVLLTNKLDQKQLFKLGLRRSNLCLNLSVHNPDDSLNNAPNDINAQLVLLEYLAKTPAIYWVSVANIDCLIQCESLFYNEYPDTQPSPWYLVHQQASHFIDDIRFKLAYCQQVIALSRKSPV